MKLHSRDWVPASSRRALDVRRLPLFLLTLAFLTVAARAEVDVAQATTGGEARALARVGDEVGVLTAAGAFAAIELPAATALKRLEPLADGWIAVGNRWRGPEMELFLLEERSGARRELPVPGGFSGPPRRSPRLVVAAGELAGLVWLEGLAEPELAVWAAAWTGESWAPPELVSPARYGAQLAPSVTVLEDGSWLLVWAAVDGGDDEILWSRRRDAAWTAPARLHPDNPVPDITPVVTTIRGGAMAVWSFLDGRHFRLVSAVFDGAGWSVGESFGADGSHRPHFLHREGRPALFYRTSWPAGWGVVDYDSAGRIVRRSFLAREASEQPLVDVTDPGGARFLLPSASPGSPPAVLLSAWNQEP